MRYMVFTFAVSFTFCFFLLCEMQASNTQTLLHELFIVSQLWCIFIVTLDTNILFVHNINCALFSKSTGNKAIVSIDQVTNFWWKSLLYNVLMIGFSLFVCSMFYIFTNPCTKSMPLMDKPWVSFYWIKTEF